MEAAIRRKRSCGSKIANAISSRSKASPSSDRSTRSEFQPKKSVRTFWSANDWLHMTRPKGQGASPRVPVSVRTCSRWPGTGCHGCGRPAPHIRRDLQSNPNHRASSRCPANRWHAQRCRAARKGQHVANPAGLRRNSRRWRRSMLAERGIAQATINSISRSARIARCSKP